MKWVRDFYEQFEERLTEGKQLSKPGITEWQGTAPDTRTCLKRSYRKLFQTCSTSTRESFIFRLQYSIRSFGRDYGVCALKIQKYISNV